MAGDDIAGAHAQAYWNNLMVVLVTGAGVYDAETEAPEGTAVDSNNEATNVGLEFTTSGTWVLEAYFQRALGACSMVMCEPSEVTKTTTRIGRLWTSRWNTFPAGLHRASSSGVLRP